ncbi:gem-associated protein 5-like [Diorhabda carinulata]|uniref:gem-associated protein 5-like n=1 Tax=Diorhabda carinulata TaxID=1163345 RepID=UPI0025A1ED39|nr:gem-associated protein 5-like [Diorhabda carinulata]
MNTLIVPPSPNWYEANILACAPDNTLIYGAKNHIVILENSFETNKAADIRIIAHAHTQKVLGVTLNKNWGEPKKWAVSISDDKTVKIWEVTTGKKHLDHDKHLSDKKVIAAAFAGDDRVVSVSEDGNIVVWNVALNDTTEIKNIFGTKVTITCMSTCPHANWLTAFGLKSGLVVVTDIRKSGKLLYKMRGHDKPVISLSWCPVPINIFPKNPNNYVGQKKRVETSNNRNDIKEEITFVQNKETGMDTHPLLKVYDSSDEEFLKECEILKNKMLGTPENVSSPNDTVDSSEEKLNQLIDKSILEKNGNDLINNLEEIIGNLNDCHNITDDEKLYVSNDSICISKEREIDPRKPEAEQSITETLKETDGHINLSDENIQNTEEKQSSIEITPQTTDEAETTDKIESNELKSTEDIYQNAQKHEFVSKQQNGNEIENISQTNTEYVTAKSNQEGSSPSQQALKLKSSAKEEEPRKEFLLASSAKESNIYIWRAGTDGRMETFISLSGKFYNRKNRALFDKIWIALNWVTPTVLLTSSKDFELLAWNLPKPKDHMSSYSIIHNEHAALLFSISSSTILLNEYNWKDGPKVSNAWSVSQDRLLINTRITDKTILSHYSTLGGHIECMQLSPLDPNRLAIGSTDSSVRVWDLSRPHTTNIRMLNFYHKIQSKVSAIAWHPTNESILAFATAEGRVGYVDPNSKLKPSVLLSQYFKSQIYKLEWGPINGYQGKFGLYAIGEGCIVYFNLENRTGRDPTVIPTPENTFIYSFGWKPDYSQLFVVARTGFIIVYSPKLKIICKHYFSYRIYDIIWHPNASDNTSDYYNWLATIGNSKNVFVYKFDIECGNNDNNIINIYQSESDINSVVWSPYVPSQMMVSCEMGIVQIWDVIKGEYLATFINCNNYEPVTAAIWSPIDPDYVISAGKDNTLKIWKISEYPPLNEKEIATTRKIAIKEISTSRTNVALKKGENDTIAQKEKKTKSLLLPKFYYLRDNSVSSDLRRLLQWKEDPESVAPMPSYCTNEVLNIFGSDETMREVIEKNENCLKQKGKHVLSSTLSLFRGDITAQVKEAIDEKRVDRWIISLAPMASTKLWQLACETYADQLSEEPGADVVETATYYLACHKVQKAIDILCEANMHREAYTLVKCRMLGKEVEHEILGRWAKQAEIDGNFEQAAQCLISMSKYENAASLLIRRSDVNILEFAVDLTSRIDNEQLHNAAVSKLKQVKEMSVNEKSNDDTHLPTIQDAVLKQNISNDAVNSEQLDESQNSSSINTESEEIYTATSVSDHNIIPEDDLITTSESKMEIKKKSLELDKIDFNNDTTNHIVEVQKVQTD